MLRLHHSLNVCCAAAKHNIRFLPRINSFYHNYPRNSIPYSFAVLHYSSAVTCRKKDSSRCPFQRRYFLWGIAKNFIMYWWGLQVYLSTRFLILPDSFFTNLTIKTSDFSALFTIVHCDILPKSDALLCIYLFYRFIRYSPPYSLQLLLRFLQQVLQTTLRIPPCSGVPCPAAALHTDPVPACDPGSAAWLWHSSCQ